jgi:ankyrin repeat protein/pimeloyl-ACP methyl ester carboxylesterase
MQRLLLTLFVVCLSAALTAGAERPPLVEAAKAGDRAALRALVETRVDVNAPDADGTTALHWVSYRDDLESARLLIAAGANVNAASDLGATPLWIAGENAGVTMVEALLEAGANPNLALLSGETPLMVASRSGKAAVVERLLGSGALVNAHAARGQTALMWAVAQKHPDVVRVLLAHGADVHRKSDVWSQVMAVPPHGVPTYNKVIPHGGDTALMFAARAGDLASAQHLVAAGANVNDADAWGVSATVLAAHAGFGDIVAFLLDRGANANAAGAGFSALHVAIMRRHTAMVRALLAHGADPNARLATWTPTRRSSKDYNFAPELVGATPFWLAARFSQPDVMRLLLEYGANAHVVHHGHYHAEEPVEPRTHVTNAVMAATGMGGGVAWVQPDRREREGLMLEAVRIAVEQGIEVNAANADGRTALDAARALKFERVAAFLVANGAMSGTRQPTQKMPVAGGSLAYDEAGRGPAVILLHGAFLDRRTWDLQMPALSARHRTVRYDIRPFGESTVPDQPYTTTDDLLAVMDTLKIDRAHLVGHSFGGGVAIEFALAHPSRVASLVLVNSSVSGATMPADEQKESMQVFVSAREGDAKAMDAWLALGLWSASRARPDVMKAIERSTATSVARFRMTAPPFIPSTPPAIGRLGEIRVPALVVSGDRDTPGNRAIADALAKGIPDATLMVVPGADHAVPIGWATALNEAVLKFLASK